MSNLTQFLPTGSLIAASAFKPKLPAGKSYVPYEKIPSNAPDFDQNGLPVGAYCTAIAWNGSVFCAVAGVSNNIAATSPDGITWTQRTLPVSAYWSAIAWNGSVFCVVATSNSTIAATSPDGITWTQRTLPVNAYWSAIAWNGSVFCAVSGGSVNGGGTNIAATSNPTKALDIFVEVNV